MSPGKLLTLAQPLTKKLIFFLCHRVENRLNFLQATFGVIVRFISI